MDRDDHNRATRHTVHRTEVGHRSEGISVTTNLRSAVKPMYRSTGYQTFVMFTPAWTCFQTRCAGDGTSVGMRVVSVVLAAGLPALIVTSFVLGVAWLSAKMLAIQRPLARVLGVIYTCDRSWPNLVDAQVQLPTSSAFSLALPGTATHRLVAKFGAISGGRVLVTWNSFRMFTVRELFLDHLLTLDGSQVLKQIAVRDEFTLILPEERVLQTYHGTCSST